MAALDSQTSIFKRKRIFAIGTPEECRALSWGFRQFGPPSSSPEVTESSLSDLRALAAEADFIVCFIDLGQPVPLSALEELGNKIPGIFVFTQPTPSQLLSVFQMSGWSAITWDGSSAENLCAQINKKLSDSDEILREKTFLREARRVVRRSLAQPSHIEWINPPLSRKTSTELPLNPGQISLTIGSDQSKSHFEVPSANSGPLVELKYIEDRWIPRAIDSSVVLPANSQSEGLSAGDTIKIGEIVLAVRAHSDMNLLSTVLEEDKRPDPSRISSLKDLKSLEDILQNLLSRGVTGETLINSGIKRATVFINRGAIDQVFSGPVSGEKALERILTWVNPSWKFHEGDYSLRNEASLKILSTDFSIFCSQVRRHWERVVALVPPGNLTIDVDPSKFSRLTTMTPTQSKVLAAVAEFRLVRDVLNYCPMRDLEIYEELIGFRKSGLIRISK